MKRAYEICGDFQDLKSPGCDYEEQEQDVLYNNL